MTNGDFAEDLSVGWTQDGWGGSGSAYRSAGIDPDPDYEAQVRKTTGVGSYRLHQCVALPSLDVDFSCTARIAVTATSTAWASAAMSLAYTDPDGLPPSTRLELMRAYMDFLLPADPQAAPDGSGASFALSPSWPTPLRRTSFAELALTREAFVRADLIDDAGHRVRTLAAGSHAAGRHVLTIDARTLTPGVYFLRAQVGGQALTRRCVVVR